MDDKQSRGTGLARAPRVRRTRDDILRDVGDVELLPFPTIDTIETRWRVTYAARSAAVRLWCSGASEKEIRMATGLTAHAARSLVERAIQRDPLSGRLLGMHVCVPGYKNPQRKKPFRQKSFDAGYAAQGHGRSGVLAHCFAMYPDIERGMLQFARTRRISSAPPIAIIKRGTCSSAFLSLCRNHGLDERNEWPFDAARRGENAIWAWYCSRKWEHHAQAVSNELGDEAGKLARTDLRAAARGIARGEGLALDRVELDEHRLHAMFDLLMPVAGRRFLSCGTRRPWALALVDRGSWTCMASALSTRTRYDTNDVKRLLVRALLPPTRYTLTIQNTNFRYRDEAAYPAEIIGSRLWRELALDADSSHLSRDSLEIAEQILKCNVANERIGDPTARAFIEGYFAHLASFMEELPSSTGDNPHAAAWREPHDAAIRYHIALPLAEQLLDVYTRNWNAKPKAACGGVSPLVLLQDKLATQRAFDKPLDFATKSNLWKLLPRFKATITRQRGLSGPFRINFSGKYGSREMADHPELRYLRDNRVHLYIQEDARFAHAVPFERTDLVFPVALIGEFCQIPHDIQFRKLCLAAAKNGACAGKADSPQLMMGVLQALGEAAQTNDAVAVLLAGTMSFMDRYGLGNEHFISLSADERDQLLSYASRADIGEPEQPPAQVGGQRTFTSPSGNLDLFGKL